MTPPLSHGASPSLLVHWCILGGAGQGVQWESANHAYFGKARAAAVARVELLGRKRASEAYGPSGQLVGAQAPAAAAGPSTCFGQRHGAGGVGNPRGMWRIWVHRLRRVAHAARCAACDHSGTRGAAAPVSNRLRGGGGGACASVSFSPSRFPRPELGISCAPEGLETDLYCMD